jgi:hypothetical protein
VEAGKQFEWLCLHFCKFLTKYKPLNKTKDLCSCDIEFTESEYLVRNWRNNSKNLRENVLFLPTVDNLESGDTFCVKELNGVLTLIVLQVTISGSHSVKINGLEIICKCYANANIEIKNKILIFVTPVNGKLNSQQNLTNVNGTVATKIPENDGTVYRKQLCEADYYLSSSINYLNSKLFHFELRLMLLLSVANVSKHVLFILI